MTSIILSIKPQFVDKILKWEKKFELRKSIPNKNFDNVIIYASAPISKIVGEFTVKQIIKSDLKSLWNRTKDYSCINKDFFDKYFEWKEIWYAIEIKEIKQYKQPLPITKYMKHPPQNFAYIK